MTFERLINQDVVQELRDIIETQVEKMSPRNGKKKFPVKYTQ